MTSKDGFGDRMKDYEQRWAGERLLPLLPICIRLDGKNFSKFTQKMEKPFDLRLMETMQYTTKKLVEETNALVGYTQSDEISLILYSDNRTSQVFFDGKLQKITSVLASMCTFYFQEGLRKFYPFYANKTCFFDCRTWNVPTKEEAVNTILWRELDATKNSISSAARVYFSHKRLHKLTGAEMQELLWQERHINWNDYPADFKRGSYFLRRTVSKKLTEDELKTLPEKHNARQNPDFIFTRNEIQKVTLPPLNKVENRVEVFFENAEPMSCYQDNPVKVNGHVLFVDGDKGIPSAIQDSNGTVALSVCKICGASESQLKEKKCGGGK